MIQSVWEKKTVIFQGLKKKKKKESLFKRSTDFVKQKFEQKIFLQIKSL